MELKKGQIMVWALFEILATDKTLAEKSLKDHIKSLKDEKTVSFTKETFEEVQEIDKPHPKVEKGYSQICEIEFVVNGFSSLINITLNYGPTMIEILEPKKIEINLGELQDGVNSVAGMMHKFLESGLGGLVILDRE